MAALNIKVQDRIARVTLNRPEVRNAFDDATIAELTETFTALAHDASVRVVVLAAEGPAFCAGADLNWMRRMAQYSDQENRADAAALAAMLQAIHTCPKPVLAAIQGDVFAGGMGLVAACDIALAVDAAQFCLSEVRLGLVPATISPYVVRAMGARAAHRYALTAERFSAAEALRIGFIHEVLTTEALEERVQVLAQTLSNNGPEAVATTKGLLQRVADQPIHQSLVDHTIDLIAQVRASSEGREGVGAFLDKRKPSWLL
jgi:methylglutaconyl-CoA hydratase